MVLSGNEDPVITDYYSYERALGREVVLPALRAAGFDPRGKSVLDVGCGYGGVLAEMTESSGAGPSVGIDLDWEMIHAAKARFPSSSVRFETDDFFNYGGGGNFDLLLMRDVLEHIVEPERALVKASTLLKPGGWIYLSYAPFYSPYGGHQHNGAGLFSRIPWLQFLPAAAFRRLLKLPGNSYKSGDGLAADMDTVLRTRLSLGRFRKILGRLPFTVAASRRYLVRPDYRLKFGLRPLACPPLPTFLAEVLCTGEEALLRRSPG